MTLTITAEFEPETDMDRKFGPSGVVEALMPLGLYDIDIDVVEG